MKAPKFTSEELRIIKRTIWTDLQASEGNLNSDYVAMPCIKINNKRVIVIADKYVVTKLEGGGFILEEKGVNVDLAPF